MDLDGMFGLLEAKCPDYARAHRDITATLNLQPETPMRCYFDAIHNDPLEWFKAFPSRSASPVALAKPKSGLLFLLEKSEAVRAELGADFCNGMARKVTEHWREIKDTLITERQVRARAGLAEVCRRMEEEAAEEAEEAEEAGVVVEAAEGHLQRAFDPQPPASASQTRAVKQLTRENEALRGKLEELKALFIEFMQDSGAAEVHVKLVRRMLPHW